MKRSHKIFILIAIILIPSITLLFSYNNNSLNSSDSNNTIIRNLSSSGDRYNPNLIIFFNKSTYKKDVEESFNSLNGTVWGRWNGTFENFSGFFGFMPTEESKNEFSEINKNCYIESNNIIEAQMNYASIQSGAVNLSSYMNGYNGDTNSSIALLDTGIDAENNYLKGKIVEEISFSNSSESTEDHNGHGTFLASLISGNGTYSYNSSKPIELGLFKNFSHSEIFGSDIDPGNYSIKLCTFNVSEAETSIFINTSAIFSKSEIDGLWLQLFHEGDLINSSHLKDQEIFYPIDQFVMEDELGLYDLRIKYHKLTNKDPSISINSSVNFFPEYYIEDYKYFSGIANATKLLNYKVLNKSGQGRISNVISALGSVIHNRTKNRIVSICLSLGNYEIDSSAVSQVIDEVANNGILVIIAAGNYGIDDVDTLNSLAKNKNAIVVGSINDQDQVTSYSSMGKNIGNGIMKPDIVAPGGSKLNQFRTIISADANTNLLTAAYGTSISAAIVSAAINILIQAKWGSWDNWNSTDVIKSAKFIKNILLMTATETNRPREDDPDSEGIIESQNRFSPPIYLEFINSTSRASLKDVHEGYGRINIGVAIDALIKNITIGSEYHGHLSSSLNDPLGKHAFARRVKLKKNHQYLFNLTEIEEGAVFDIYLYSNNSNRYGEPILLESSRKSFGIYNYFYFTPQKNETNAYIIIKAINGEGNFTLNITEVENNWNPQLKVPEISYNGDVKNTTVLSLRERDGENPMNNITLDRYRFYIEYFDNDTTNVPPQEVYVSIPQLSKNFTMTQRNIADQNYTNGAIFTSKEIEFPKNITYDYYFFARDGLKHAYYPAIGTNLSIKIEYPKTIKSFPYEHSFNNGLDNWSIIGTGWNILHQKNTYDSRLNSEKNKWNAVYFGSDHDFPKNYTYQPMVMDEFLNGSFFSPYYDLTDLEEDLNPILKIGMRVSINEGDFINLLINVNGSGWNTTPLKSYTEMEEDWNLEAINLTEYKGTYVRFKFEADLDDNNDLINYKGFIIDYISIVNYINNQSPEIYFDPSMNIQSSQDLKFQKIKFSLNYYDIDNNYPEYVYIEINDINYSMINYFGDWNASSNILDDNGIIFLKSLTLEEISNLSFRFHISDGENSYSSQFYNKNNSLISFNIPSSLEYNVYQDSNPIGYQFNESLENFYVAGVPVQKENTAWLRGDDSWHVVKKLFKYYLYGGLANRFNSEDSGYNENWEIELITRPLDLITNKKVFLEYSYEIDLEFQGDDGDDKGGVYISTDYGETWNMLKNYTSNNEGTEIIDISQEVGDTVMFKFALITDDNSGASNGFGWLLSDIYVGYDRDQDHIKPSIIPITPLNGTEVGSKINITLNLSDNEFIDISKLEIRIDGILYVPDKIKYNNQTGDLSFIWNTLEYKDGWHSIKISVYDEYENYGELILNLRVNNFLTNLINWMPWIIIGITIIITLPAIYIYLKRKNRSIINKIKRIREKEDKITKKVERHQDLPSDKPLTLYCKYCDSWFYSNNFDIICPSCGRDQIYAAYKCLNCGRWYFKEKPGVYYCKECDGIKLIKREKEEMQEIIGRKYKKVLKKFENKRSEDKII